MVLFNQVSCLTDTIVLAIKLCFGCLGGGEHPTVFLRLRGNGECGRGRDDVRAGPGAAALRPRHVLAQDPRQQRRHRRAAGGDVVARRHRIPGNLNQLPSTELYKNPSISVIL